MIVVALELGMTWYLILDNGMIEWVYFKVMILADLKFKYPYVLKAYKWLINEIILRLKCVNVLVNNLEVLAK